jgi:hypothetical protein
VAWPGIKSSGAAMAGINLRGDWEEHPNRAEVPVMPTILRNSRRLKSAMSRPLPHRAFRSDRLPSEPKRNRQTTHGDQQNSQRRAVPLESPSKKLLKFSWSELVWQPANAAAKGQSHDKVTGRAASGLSHGLIPRLTTGHIETFFLPCLRGSASRKTLFAATHPCSAPSPRDLQRRTWLFRANLAGQIVQANGPAQQSEVSHPNGVSAGERSSLTILRLSQYRKYKIFGNLKAMFTEQRETTSLVVPKLLINLRLARNWSPEL